MSILHIHRSTLLLLAAAVLGFASLSAAGEKTVVVNEYFGKDYKSEPVSFDVTFDKPVAADLIRLKDTPCQAEVLEGTADSVTRARVWTLVDFDQRGQQRFTVTTRAKSNSAEKAMPFQMGGTETVQGVKVRVVGNGKLWVKMPVESAAFALPVSAFDIPGPVVSLSADGKRWVGSGYFDSMLRVEKIDCSFTVGHIFAESSLVYHFENDKTYRVKVRLYAGARHAQLVEDFDLGGASKYVFNLDDLPVDSYLETGDGGRYTFKPLPEKGSPADHFVEIEGQCCLARMVIWTQHNYFGGKQETIVVKAPPKAVLEELYQKGKHTWQTERYDRRAKKRVTVDQEVTPRNTTYAGAELKTLSGPLPPSLDDLCVGAFFIRPDRWTRAKVNHVDLYMRPEVPGDRMTRGVVGLKGARARLAMEAWLVDGHREWAMFVTPSGKTFTRKQKLSREEKEKGVEPKTVEYVGLDPYIKEAHVQVGVWPLDRINRQPLVWNSDGSDVSPDAARPTGETAHNSGVLSVLHPGRGRSGLQYFNGSNGHIRSTMGSGGYADWARDHRNVKAADVDVSSKMAGWAMMALMCMDESAYPGTRAMLPWTHAEALNPFYQGMENMNFNADRYRLVSMLGEGLMLANHPRGEEVFLHGQQQMDMALDRYVYPRSGCWEESHSYCGHTIHNLLPLVELLRKHGRRDYYEDPRFASLFEFWCYAHSPRDPALGGVRVPPPVGDHGLSVGKFVGYFRGSLASLASAKNENVRKVASHMAWMLPEIGGEVPSNVDIKPVKPDLSSKWLQGYGSVLRSESEGGKIVTMRLVDALWREGKGDEKSTSDLVLRYTVQPGQTLYKPFVKGPDYNTGRHSGELSILDDVSKCTFTLGDDRWVKGGKGEVSIRKGSYEGMFKGEKIRGTVKTSVRDASAETYMVVRAGQSWGHHHMDKGSLWLWARNVHFFGDAAWGAPPGGTYGNKYKQGPASGTQIELHGVTNWTLPCKYAAPFVSDDEYSDGYDYVNARCMYPFNPKLDVSESTAVALRNGYDRQVLFVHPDVFIVRDNVETVCPTTWRMHSYQPDGTKASGASATLTSPQGVVGDLQIAYPSDVKISAHAKTESGDSFGSPAGRGKKRRYDTRSVMLKWDMPSNTSATWVFAARDKEDKAPKVEVLDEEGKVIRVTLDDGTEITAVLSIEPVTTEALGRPFEGTVGLRFETPDGKVTRKAIRGEFVGD